MNYRQTAGEVYVRADINVTINLHPGLEFGKKNAGPKTGVLTGWCSDQAFCLS